MIAMIVLFNRYLFSLRKLNNRTQINEHPAHLFKCSFSSQPDKIKVRR